MTSRVSVVVPFYNEEANVRLLYQAVTAAMAAIPELSYECLFVDDGSSDGTAAQLQRIKREDARVRTLHLRRNAGQSAALMAGLRAAEGRFILTLDGDLQNDPADFPTILKLLDEYDCVCGVRMKRQDTWFRRVSSRVANRVRNAILHDGIQDSGCGIKGFRRECIDYLPCFNGIHRFFAVFVRAAGFSIVECPVRHHARRFGRSRYGLHNRLWRGIYDLIGVAWLRRRFVVYQALDAPEGITHSVAQGRSLDAASAAKEA